LRHYIIFLCNASFFAQINGFNGPKIAINIGIPIIAMKRKNILFVIILIAGIFTAGSISFSQSTWVEQTSNTESDLNGIIFLDQDNGIAIGNDGVIITTSDKGESWTEQKRGTNDFLDICKISDSSALIVGENNSVYSTHDMGVSWEKISFSGNPYMTCFFNESTGLILCRTAWEGTEVFKTIDGGNNWYLLSVHEDFTINGITRANDSTIFLAGLKINPPPNSEAAIFKIGINDDIISIVATPIVSAGFFDISFNDQGTGYAGGAGHSSISTDGGLTWSDNSSWSRSVTLYNNMGYATSNNFILRTTNSGLNWTIDFNNQQNYLNEVVFLNENEAFAVGLNGCILKKSTAITNINTNNNSPSSFYLKQNYPNPFNPSTNIKFELPFSGKVSLTVYDMTGKVTAVIVNEELPAGNYEYIFDGANLPSGIYLYRLQIGDMFETRKMTLVK
jgi:photosystem II stability/assembly factor-like uncharacterized protein